MENLIVAVKNWPVLVQGAIGSGLFWLFLILGQNLTAFCSPRLSALFKNRKETNLFNQLPRIRAVKSTIGTEGAAYASILWFRASRDMLKGLIWLALGLSFDAFTAVLGIVGFVGSLYYFFAALNTVRRMTDDGDLDERAREIEEQLKKVQKA